MRHSHFMQYDHNCDVNLNIVSHKTSQSFRKYGIPDALLIFRGVVSRSSVIGV